MTYRETELDKEQTRRDKITSTITEKKLKWYDQITSGNNISTVIQQGITLGMKKRIGRIIKNALKISLNEQEKSFAPTGILARKQNMCRRFVMFSAAQ